MVNNTTSAEVDKYLEQLSSDKKEILEKIRKNIKSIVPKAEECISYGIPAFRYHGLLVGYAAFKNHFSFFPMDPEVIEKFKEDLDGFKIAKGTIQFTKERMLPVTIMKKIVEVRKTENERKKNK